MTTVEDDFFDQIAQQHQQNIEHQKEVSLFAFFEHYKAIKPYPITAYINASELYHTDYRLLPAISIAESSGGRHACGYNWWGWGSCKSYNFKSITEGIYFINEALATNHYYKGKSNYEILRAYNPNPEYAIKVIKLMNEIK